MGTKAKEIIEEIKKHFFPGEVNVIVCEDVLADNVCKALKEAAKVLKVKIEEVDAAVREAVNKGLTKAKDIIRFVRSKIDSFVKEIIDMIKKHFFPGVEGELINVITCEDVLSATVCHDLRAIAAKLKVKIEMIDEIIRQLVKEKITEAKEIIKRVREKLVELATNFKCTDILSEHVCNKIKVEAKKVDEIIKKIVVEGVTKAKEIIKKIIE